MRRGVTITEVLAVLVAVVMLTGLAVPAITAKTCDDLKNVSIRNLQTLMFAHAMYAADWSDRQFTLVRDDLGDFALQPVAACEALAAAGDPHPPVILGEDCDGVVQGFSFENDCDDIHVALPIVFPGWGLTAVTGLGSFRIPNARGFHEYVNGRFFDPTFYAPKDAPIYEQVAPLFGVDCEYASTEITAELVFSSSYALSPAAMLHPDVLSLNGQGDYWQSPFNLPGGFQSPTVSQALYPALKTRMIEHSWLQNPPAPCNNVFGGCVPYFFNHGFNSVPMTLFFDGRIDGLSPFEAMRAEARSAAQEDLWLWSRDTPFGHAGYFIDDGWDATSTGYHILTIDGIRGRDTVFED